MVGAWQRPKGVPLCAGFVAVAVTKSDVSASFGAEAEYVYGKGTRLHLNGEYDASSDAFTFHDQQGGTFIFRANGSASFRGGSGQLSGNFTQQNSSHPAAFVTAPTTSSVPSSRPTVSTPLNAFPTRPSAVKCADSDLGCMSMQLRDDMTEQEAISAIGYRPNKVEMTTCGSSTDHPWQCKLLTFGGLFNRLTVYLTRNPAGIWEVNSWHVYP
jgi:hypothetical protein